MVESIVFLGVTTASFCLSGGLSDGAFLGANPIIILDLNRNAYKIVQQYQIWRLFTAIFIHVGFSHWIMNMITQIVFGSWLEAMVGFRLAAYTYFVSGIGANIFAATC